MADGGATAQFNLGKLTIDISNVIEAMKSVQGETVKATEKLKEFQEGDQRKTSTRSIGREIKQSMDGANNAINSVQQDLKNLDSQLKGVSFQVVEQQLGSLTSAVEKMSKKLDSSFLAQLNEAEKKASGISFASVIKELQTLSQAFRITAKEAAESNKEAGKEDILGQKGFGLQVNALTEKMTVLRESIYNTLTAMRQMRSESDLLEDFFAKAFKVGDGSQDNVNKLDDFVGRIQNIADTIGDIRGGIDKAFGNDKMHNVQEQINKIFGDKQNFKGIKDQIGKIFENAGTEADSLSSRLEGVTKLYDKFVSLSQLLSGNDFIEGAKTSQGIDNITTSLSNQSAMLAQEKELAKQQIDDLSSYSEQSLGEVGFSGKFFAKIKAAIAVGIGGRQYKDADGNLKLEEHSIRNVEDAMKSLQATMDGMKANTDLFQKLFPEGGGGLEKTTKAIEDSTKALNELQKKDDAGSPVTALATALNSMQNIWASINPGLEKFNELASSLANLNFSNLGGLTNLVSQNFEGINSFNSENVKALNRVKFDNLKALDGIDLTSLSNLSGLKNLATDIPSSMLMAIGAVEKFSGENVKLDNLSQQKNLASQVNLTKAGENSKENLKGVFEQLKTSLSDKDLGAGLDKLKVLGETVKGWTAEQLKTDMAEVYKSAESIKTLIESMKPEGLEQVLSGTSGVLKGLGALGTLKNISQFLSDIQTNGIKIQATNEQVQALGANQLKAAEAFGILKREADGSPFFSTSAKMDGDIGGKIDTVTNKLNEFKLAVTGTGKGALKPIFTDMQEKTTSIAGIKETVAGLSASFAEAAKEASSLSEVTGTVKIDEGMWTDLVSKIESVTAALVDLKEKMQSVMEVKLEDGAASNPFTAMITTINQATESIKAFQQDWQSAMKFNRPENMQNVSVVEALVVILGNATNEVKKLQNAIATVDFKPGSLSPLTDQLSALCQMLEKVGETYAFVNKQDWGSIKGMAAGGNIGEAVKPSQSATQEIGQVQEQAQTMMQALQDIDKFTFATQTKTIHDVSLAFDSGSMRGKLQRLDEFPFAKQKETIKSLGDGMNIEQLVDAMQFLSKETVKAPNVTVQDDWGQTIISKLNAIDGFKFDGLKAAQGGIVSKEVTGKIEDAFNGIAPEFTKVVEKMNNLGSQFKVESLATRFNGFTPLFVGVRQGLNNLAQQVPTDKIKAAFDGITPTFPNVETAIKNVASKFEKFSNQFGEDNSQIQRIEQKQSGLENAVPADKIKARFESINPSFAKISTALKGVVGSTPTAEIKDAMNGITAEMTGLKESLFQLVNSFDGTILGGKFNLVRSQFLGIREDMDAQINAVPVGALGNKFAEVKPNLSGIETGFQNIPNLLDAVINGINDKFKGVKDITGISLGTLNDDLAIFKDAINAIDPKNLQAAVNAVVKLTGDKVDPAKFGGIAQAMADFNESVNFDSVVTKLNALNSAVDFTELNTKIRDIGKDFSTDEIKSKLDEINVKKFDDVTKALSAIVGSTKGLGTLTKILDGIDKFKFTTLPNTVQSVFTTIEETALVSQGIVTGHFQVIDSYQFETLRATIAAIENELYRLIAGFEALQSKTGKGTSTNVKDVVDDLNHNLQSAQEVLNKIHDIEEELAYLEQALPNVKQIFSESFDLSDTHDKIQTIITDIGTLNDKLKEVGVNNMAEWAKNYEKIKNIAEKTQAKEEKNKASSEAATKKSEASQLYEDWDRYVKRLTKVSKEMEGALHDNIFKPEALQSYMTEIQSLETLLSDVKARITEIRESEKSAAETFGAKVPSVLSARREELLQWQEDNARMDTARTRERLSVKAMAKEEKKDVKDLYAEYAKLQRYRFDLENSLDNAPKRGAGLTGQTRDIQKKIADTRTQMDELKRQWEEMDTVFRDTGKEKTFGINEQIQQSKRDIKSLTSEVKENAKEIQAKTDNIIAKYRSTLSELEAAQTKIRDPKVQSGSALEGELRLQIIDQIAQANGLKNDLEVRYNNYIGNKQPEIKDLNERLAAIKELNTARIREAEAKRSDAQNIENSKKIYAEYRIEVERLAKALAGLNKSQAGTNDQSYWADRVSEVGNNLDTLEERIKNIGQGFHIAAEEEKLFADKARVLEEAKSGALAETAKREDAEMTAKVNQMYQRYNDLLAQYKTHKQIMDKSEGDVYAAEAAHVQMLVVEMEGLEQSITRVAEGYRKTKTEEDALFKTRRAEIDGDIMKQAGIKLAAENEKARVEEVKTLLDDLGHYMSRYQNLYADRLLLPNDSFDYSELSNQLREVAANIVTTREQLESYRLTAKEASEESRMFAEHQRTLDEAMSDSIRKQAQNRDLNASNEMKRQYQRYEELTAMWAKAKHGFNTTTDNAELKNFYGAQVTEYIAKMNALQEAITRVSDTWRDLEHENKMFSKTGSLTDEMINEMFTVNATRRGEAIKDQVKELYRQYSEQLSILNTRLSERGTEATTHGMGTERYTAIQAAIADTIIELNRLESAYRDFDESYRDTTGKEVELANKRREAFSKSDSDDEIKQAAQRDENLRRYIQNQYNAYQSYLSEAQSLANQIQNKMRSNPQEYAELDRQLTAVQTRLHDCRVEITGYDEGLRNTAKETELFGRKYTEIFENAENKGRLDRAIAGDDSTVRRLREQYREYEEYLGTYLKLRRDRSTLEMGTDEYTEVSRQIAEARDRMDELQVAIMTVNRGMRDTAKEADMFSRAFGAGDEETNNRLIYEARQRDDRRKDAIRQQYEEYKAMLVEYENLNKEMIGMDKNTEGFEARQDRIRELGTELADLQHRIELNINAFRDWKTESRIFTEMPNINNRIAQLSIIRSADANDESRRAATNVLYDQVRQYKTLYEQAAKSATQADKGSPLFKVASQQATYFKDQIESLRVVITSLTAAYRMEENAERELFDLGAVKAKIEEEQTRRDREVAAAETRRAAAEREREEYNALVEVIQKMGNIQAEQVLAAFNEKTVATSGAVADLANNMRTLSGQATEMLGHMTADQAMKAWAETMPDAAKSIYDMMDKIQKKREEVFKAMTNVKDSQTQIDTYKAQIQELVKAYEALKTIVEGYDKSARDAAKEGNMKDQVVYADKAAEGFERLKKQYADLQTAMNDALRQQRGSPLEGRFLADADNIRMEIDKIKASFHDLLGGSAWVSDADKAAEAMKNFIEQGIRASEVKNVVRELNEEVRAYNKAVASGNAGEAATHKAAIDMYNNRIAVMKEALKYMQVGSAQYKETHQAIAELEQAQRGLGKIQEQTIGGYAFGRLKSLLSMYMGMRLIRTVWSNAKTYATEYYNTLNEIRVVTGETEEQTAKVGENIRKLAKEMSVASKDLATAAVTFYRQGLGDEEVLERLKYTTMYAKVTSEEFNSSAELLTATSNSYQDFARTVEEAGKTVTKTGYDMQEIASIFVALGANAATSGSEVSRSLQKVASAASTFGLSLESVSAMVATLSEKTRLAPEQIGTAMNSMISRLHSIKQKGYNDEDETKINDISKALRNINVVLQDNQGNWRDTDTILEDIAKQWQNLTDKQKSYIATTMGGTKQQNFFLALMNDMSKGLEGGSRYFELQNIAMQSNGSVVEAYNTWLDSATAAQGRMTESLQELYSHLNINIFKGFYNEIANVVDWLNKGIDATNGLNVAVPILGATIVGVIASIVKAIRGISKAGGIVRWFTDLTVGKKFALVVAGITAIIAAMTALANGDNQNKVKDILKDTETSLQKVKTKINEIKEAQKDFASKKTSIKSLLQEYLELSDKQNKTTEESERFNQILIEMDGIIPGVSDKIREMTEKYGEQTGAIKGVTEALEEQLRVQQMAAQAQAREGFADFVASSNTLNNAKREQENNKFVRDAFLEWVDSIKYGGSNRYTWAEDELGNLIFHDQKEKNYDGTPLMLTIDDVLADLYGTKRADGTVHGKYDYMRQQEFAQKLFDYGLRDLNDEAGVQNILTQYQSNAASIVSQEQSIRESLTGLLSPFMNKLGIPEYMTDMLDQEFSTVIDNLMNQDSISYRDLDLASTALAEKSYQYQQQYLDLMATDLGQALDAAYKNYKNNPSKESADFYNKQANQYMSQFNNSLIKTIPEISEQTVAAVESATEDNRTYAQISADSKEKILAAQKALQNGFVDQFNQQIAESFDEEDTFLPGEYSKAWKRLKEQNEWIAKYMQEVLPILGTSNPLEYNEVGTALKEAVLPFPLSSTNSQYISKFTNKYGPQSKLAYTETPDLQSAWQNILNLRDTGTSDDLIWMYVNMLKGDMRDAISNELIENGFGANIEKDWTQFFGEKIPSSIQELKKIITDLSDDAGLSTEETISDIDALLGRIKGLTDSEALGKWRDQWLALTDTEQKALTAAMKKLGLGEGDAGSLGEMTLEKAGRISATLQAQRIKQLEEIADPGKRVAKGTSDLFTKTGTDYRDAEKDLVNAVKEYARTSDAINRIAEDRTEENADIWDSAMAQIEDFTGFDAEYITEHMDIVNEYINAKGDEIARAIAAYQEYIDDVTVSNDTLKASLEETVGYMNEAMNTTFTPYTSVEDQYKNTSFGRMSMISDEDRLAQKINREILVPLSEDEFADVKAEWEEFTALAGEDVVKSLTSSIEKALGVEEGFWDQFIGADEFDADKYAELLTAQMKQAVAKAEEKNKIPSGYSDLFSSDEAERSNAKGEMEKQATDMVKAFQALNTLRAAEYGKEEYDTALENLTEVVELTDAVTEKLRKGDESAMDEVDRILQSQYEKTEAAYDLLWKTISGDMEYNEENIEQIRSTGGQIEKDILGLIAGFKEQSLEIDKELDPLKGGIFTTDESLTGLEKWYEVMKQTTPDEFTRVWKTADEAVKQLYEDTSLFNEEIYTSEGYTRDYFFANIEQFEGGWETLIDGIRRKLLEAKEATLDMSKALPEGFSGLFDPNSVNESASQFRQGFVTLEQAWGAYNSLIEGNLSPDDRNAAIDRLASSGFVTVSAESLKQGIGFAQVLTDLTKETQKYGNAMDYALDEIEEYNDMSRTAADVTKAQGQMEEPWFLDAWNIVGKANGMTLDKVIQYGNSLMTAGSKVDLGNRKQISGEQMIRAGWEEYDPESYATLYSMSSGIGTEEHPFTLLYTPILPGGEVLSPQSLENYINETFAGATSVEDIMARDRFGIVMGAFEGWGEDAVGFAEALSQAAHTLNAAIDEMRDTGETTFDIMSQSEEYMELAGKSGQEWIDKMTEISETGEGVSKDLARMILDIIQESGIDAESIQGDVLDFANSLFEKYVGEEYWKNDNMFGSLSAAIDEGATEKIEAYANAISNLSENEAGLAALEASWNSLESATKSSLKSGNKYLEIYDDLLHDAEKDTKKLNRALKSAEQLFRMKKLEDGNKIMDGTTALFEAMATGASDIAEAGAPLLQTFKNLSKGLDAMETIQNGAKEGTEEYTTALSNLAEATSFSVEQLSEDGVMDRAFAQLVQDAEYARYSAEALANALFSVAGSSFNPSTWTTGLISLGSSASAAEQDLASMINTMLSAAGARIMAVMSADGKVASLKVSGLNSKKTTKKPENTGGGGGGGGGGGDKDKADPKAERQSRWLEQIKFEGDQIQDLLDRLAILRSRYEEEGYLTGVINTIAEENKWLEKQTEIWRQNKDAIAEKMAETKEELKTVQVGTKEYDQVLTRLAELQDSYAELDKSIMNNESTILSNVKAIEEQKKAIRDLQIELRSMVLQAVQDRRQREEDAAEATISIQQRIIEAIKNRYEEEYELQQKATQAKIDALNKESEAMSEALDERKRLSEEQEKETELAKLQAQYARIIADPTRAKEALELQKKITDLQKEISWDNAEKEVEKEQKAIEKNIEAIEDYQAQQDEYHEKFMEDNNNFVGESNAIMAGGDEAIKAWLMANDKDYLHMTAEEQAAELKSINEELDAMNMRIKTDWEEVERIISGGIESILSFLRENTQSYLEMSPLERQKQDEEWIEFLTKTIPRSLEDIYPNLGLNEFLNTVATYFEDSGTGGGSGGGPGGGGPNTNDKKIKVKTPTGKVIEITAADTVIETGTEAPGAVDWIKQVTGGTVLPIDVKNGESLLGSLGNDLKHEVITALKDNGDLKTIKEAVQANGGKYVYEGHAVGGDAGYTGLHWLEKGERVLTPQQNNLFMELVESMERMSRVYVGSQRINPKFADSTSGHDITFDGGIQVYVDQLIDDNDYDEVAEKVMDHINERLGRGMSVGGVRIA